MTRYRTHAGALGAQKLVSSSSPLAALRLTEVQYFVPRVWLSLHGSSADLELTIKLNREKELVPFRDHEVVSPDLEGHSPSDYEQFAWLDSDKYGQSDVTVEFMDADETDASNLDLYWVAYDGTRLWKDALTKGEIFSHTTSHGHSWILRNASSGRIVHHYRASTARPRVHLTVGPYGLCVDDVAGRREPLETPREELMQDIVAQNLLQQVQDLLEDPHVSAPKLWQLYQVALWSAKLRATVSQIFNEMGEIFMHGTLEGAISYPMALMFFQMARRFGNTDARVNIGFLLENGLIAPQEKFRTALYQYYCAAKAGNVRASLLLGWRTTHGIGVPKDCPKSVQYYQTAADKVYANPSTLEKLVEEVDLSEHSEHQDATLNMDENELRFYEQHADTGHAWAQNYMGQVYLFGLRGQAQDFPRAERLFRAAAEQGDGVAADYLGHMRFNGYGGERDVEEAVKLYRQAAEQNVTTSQTNLGFMFWTGNGVPRNMTEALRWLHMAADNGHAEATYYLGMIYRNGEGVEADLPRALALFELASQVQHHKAMYHLADMYTTGEAGIYDCLEARRLYRYVAEYHNVKFGLDAGRRAFEAKKYAQAFLFYAKAAEMGYINGQINAAWLASKSYHADVFSAVRRRGGQCVPTNKDIAFRYYSFAAVQNLSKALRVVGDYYWYLWPPVGEETRTCREESQQAAERRALVHMTQRLVSTPLDHQAMACQLYCAEQSVIDDHASFSCGYCHEHGVHGPRSVATARNMYWRAVRINPDAVLPVGLALLKLEASWPLENVLQWVKT